VILKCLKLTLSRALKRRSCSSCEICSQNLHSTPPPACSSCSNWLISQDEQLRRFKARESVSFKHFKITDEDWRNREQWPRYETAAAEMIERTSTTQAPWTLVEAEDKNWARIKILQTLVERIETALD